MIDKRNLDDSRALLKRAREHFAELNALLGPGLWSTSERRDSDSGEWHYYLRLDRQRLITAKPIIADCANNVAAALDHVSAAIAKAKGHSRLRHFYFPWGFTDEEFNKSLTKAKKVIGAEMAKAISAARAKHRHEVNHVAAAKQISNSGKHWELMITVGTAHAIALCNPGGGQRIFQIPSDAFSATDVFEYYRGSERLPSAPLSIVIGQTIEGLDDYLPTSPDLILECSFRFVEGIILAIEAAMED